MPGIFENFRNAVIHQSGDRETLAVLQIHFRSDLRLESAGITKPEMSEHW